DAQKWFTEEHEKKLGAVYRWIQFRLAATLGDYELADKELSKLYVERAVNFSTKEMRPLSEAAALSIARRILEGWQLRGGGPGTLGPAAINMEAMFDDLRKLSGLMRRNADVSTMRGLMALEVGDTAAAETHFRRAVATWSASSAAAFPGRPIADYWL